MIAVRKHRKKKIIVIITTIIFLLVLFFAAQYVLNKQNHNSQKDNQAGNGSLAVKSDPKIKNVSMRLLVTGNSFWGRYTNDHAMKSELKTAFPFARLNEFHRDQYNAWITGLECPTTEKGVAMTSAEQEAELKFNCDPAYLLEFAKWFNVVTLANNHSDNMGDDGFIETEKSLEENNIQHIGHYDPYKIDDICEVVSLPATVEYDNGEKKQELLPLSLCGYHFVFKLPNSDGIMQLQPYSQLMTTIAMPHGGAEYQPGPDEIKTNLYHSFIDNGADMVLGDHPHWVQNTEAYKGKMIVYSMGNFMFDQQRGKELTRSAAIDLTLTLKNGQSMENVKKWLKLAPECAKHKDNCLENAQQQKLEKIQFAYSFDVVATDNLGYQTHPDPEGLPSIKQRLNWDTTLSQLAR